jgi:predicted RNA-binding Zn ribbon-like protein
VSTATVWTDDHFIAGDVALDFANTVFRRTPELGADLFNEPAALITWLRHNELMPAHPESREPVGDPEAALGEARELRQQFWMIFEAQSEGHDLPAAALAQVFDTARDGIDHDVSVGADGSATPRTARGALAALALRGIRLVLSPPARPVRTCDRCGWFFLDSSRGRRRRWCSMKTCGNQAKVARFRSVHTP